MAAIATAAPRPEARKKSRRPQVPTSCISQILSTCAMGMPQTTAEISPHRERHVRIADPVVVYAPHARNVLRGYSGGLLFRVVFASSPVMNDAIGHDHIRVRSPPR